MVDNEATWSRDIPADILDKIEGGKEASSESVTVWIDPLDATQEYTGEYVTGVSHPHFKDLFSDDSDNYRDITFPR